MIHHQHSEAGTAERDSDKGKQREEPATHNQTSTSGDLSSPDDLDSGGNRALWKSLLRDRRKDGKKALAEVTQGTSSEVVEVHAQRVRKASFSSSCLHRCSYEIRKNSCLSYLSGNQRRRQRLGCPATTHIRTGPFKALGARS